MTEGHGSPPDLLARLTSILLRWRVPVLSLVTLLTVAVWPLADQLEFDQSIESFYAKDDVHFSAFARSKATFGGDEFAILAWQEPELFNPADGSVSEHSEQRFTDLADLLLNVPGVVPGSVQHVADAMRFPYERDRIRELITGVLIGEDGQTTAVVVRLLPEASAPVVNGVRVSRAETIARIRAIAARQPVKTYVVGEPIQIHDMFRLVEKDGRTLFHVSLLILATVLFLLLRTLRWVVFPLLVVLLSIRWTEALMVLSGARLSMVSSMLNSLVTIIGVATATHIAIGLRSRLVKLPRREALLSTLAELLPAVFWTCLTTAVGFGALLSSNITPVRSFGLMMTVATALVFVVVVVVTPGLMAGWWADSRPASGAKPHPAGDPALRRAVWLDLLFGDPRPVAGERYILQGLGGVSSLVERRPGVVIVAALAIVAFCGVGLSRLRVETDFSRNFRDSSELVQSLTFVETHLGGAGTWEVNFPAPRLLNDQYLDDVRTLAQRLRDELQIVPSIDVERSSDSSSSRRSVDRSPSFPTAAEGRLTKVVCLTDGLDLVPKEVGFGFFKRTLSLEQRLNILNTMQSDLLSSLYNADAARMRIVLRGLERQASARKLELIDQVERIATESFGGLGTTSVVAAQVDDRMPAGDSTRIPASSAPYPTETTGLFVLMTFLIESLLRDQLVSFVVAAVGIGTMMAIAFKSVKIGLISILPNLFPIVLVIGSMGWVGLPVNIATAMIASVSMGLTVDSSIHYLAVWRRARRAGASVSEAIAAAQTQVGLALIFANVALVAGFIVLTLSAFIPLVYFGLLVSVAMLGGLVGNLFLLPLLLSHIDCDSVSPLPE